jgi:hypothetical protein
MWLNVQVYDTFVQTSNDVAMFCVTEIFPGVCFSFHFFPVTPVSSILQISVTE